MPGAGFVPARAWASPDRSPRPDGRGIVRPVARVFRVRWCPGVGRRRRIPSCDDVRPAVGVRLRPRVRRVVCASVGASSSVGQSTRLISVGSEVQVLPGPYRPVRRGVCGGVAQPGEHLLCTQGVAGSNPAVSTGVPRCAGVRVGGRVRRRGVFGPWIGAVVLSGTAAGSVGVAVRVRAPVRSPPWCGAVCRVRVVPPCGARVIFGQVNRVLVRPWTRGTPRGVSAPLAPCALGRSGVCPRVCPPPRPVFPSDRVSACAVVARVDAPPDGAGVFRGV